ncbi:hypothetical protein K8I31_14950 [bacterium]|nr:hypothetical protein [bacterium]
MKRTIRFVAVTFMLAQAVTGYAQETWQDYKQLARESYAKSGNLRIHSNQVMMTNFSDPTFRETINKFGGMPIISIENDLIEEFSLKNNVYIQSFDQTHTYAKSPAALDIDGYGEHIVNHGSATQFITRDNILLKSVRTQQPGSRYWDYKINEDRELIKDSSVNPVFGLLFGDLLRDKNDFLFVNSLANGKQNNVSVSIQKNKNKDYQINFNYLGRLYMQRTYMAEHPEKMLSEITFSGPTIKSVLTVNYEDMKPKEIVKYTFSLGFSDPNRINADEFLQEHCSSSLKIEIVEYEEGIADEIFATDFKESLKDGDVLVDHIAGTYQVIGDENSMKKLSEIK